MWYAMLKEKRVGPVSEEQLRQWRSEGRIADATPLWREGWPEWRPAADVFAQAGPPPAPKQGAWAWESLKDFLVRSRVGLTFAGVAAPALIAVLWLYAIGRWKTAFPFKILVSSAYLLIAVAGNMHRTASGLFMFLALCFFWGGDLFTGLMAGDYYKYGLILFMAAYLILMIAFVVHGVAIKWTAGAAAAFAVFAAGLWFRVKGVVPEGYEEVTVSYIAVMTVFCALAVGQWKSGGSILALVGSFVILAGDLFLARNVANKSPFNETLLLAFHYLGLLILAFSVYEKDARTSGQDDR